MRSLQLLVLLSPIVAFAATTTDATCGGAKGKTCLGSKWGNCCSQFGWCGSTTDYCGTGCQSAFGNCNNAAAGGISSSSIGRSSSSTPGPSSSSGFRTSTVSRSTAPSPSASQLVSVNARCGPSFGGRTCMGSRWGDCCSQFSYCGSTVGYCAADTCQKGYGRCNSASSSSSLARSSTSQQSSLAVAVAPTSSSLTPSSTSSSVSVSSSSSASPSVFISPSSTSSVLSSLSSTAPGVSSSLVPTLSTANSSPITASSSAVTSSLVVTSSSITTSASSVASPPAACATTVASCSPLSGPLDASCPASDGMCSSGYFIRCGHLPENSVATQISQTVGSVVPNADACALNCNRAPSCITFSFVPNSPFGTICTLYSSVGQLNVNDVGDTYLRLCTQVAVASIPSPTGISSMSSMTSSTGSLSSGISTTTPSAASSSFSASSSTLSAPAVSTTPTPSSTIQSSTAAPTASSCARKGLANVNGINYVSTSDTTFASCKISCQQRYCRAFGFNQNSHSCLVTYAQNPPSSDQAFSPMPEDSDTYTVYDLITCPGEVGVGSTSTPTSSTTVTPTPTPSPSSTPQSSSTAQASSTPSSSCGRLGSASMSGIQYKWFSNTGLAACSGICMNWNAGGVTCRAWGVDGIGTCAIAVGNPPPSPDLAFAVATSSTAFRVYDTVTCSQ